MIQRLKILAGWAWFPWLMALYPIIFLYRQNIGLLFIEDFFASLIVAALIVAVLVGLLKLVLHDTYKAAAMTVVLVIFFFSYGHIVRLIPHENASPAVIFLHDNLLIFWLIGMALAVFAIWRWMSPGVARQIAPALNLVALVLVIIPSVVVGLDVIGKLAELAPARLTRPEAEKVMNDSAHPDIYYFILDAYPSNRFLARHWAYDNYPFTDELEDRGFVVAYDSEANYSSTLTSLASSLNMRLLEEGESPITDPSGVTYARKLIADNEVAHQLQERGYTYIWMMSGFARPSTIADTNIDFFNDGPKHFGPNELAPDPHVGSQSFYPVLLNTTILSGAPVIDDIVAMTAPRQADPDNLPLGYTTNRRVRLTWQEVEKIPEMPEATFTVVHLLVPHLPIRFDREGKNVFTAWITDPEAAFFEQLEYVNNRTLEMVDTIQKNSSVPPIIILQGDHGSKLGWPLADDQLGNLYAPYFPIMNAYFFPGHIDAIYPTISPVNSYRVMFNSYFDGEYDLLDDSFQRWSLYTDLFHFRLRSEYLVR